MASCFSLYIALGTVCVNLLSAVPQFNVSGTVGSTAVLPCKLISLDTEAPYIRWRTVFGIVFERKGSYHSEGYKGRVDVPVEELRKGNCSLVFSNLTLTDAGSYTSYQRVMTSSVQLSHVKLSVYEISKEGKRSSETTHPTSDAGMKNPHSVIMILSLLSYLLFLYIL